MKQEKAIEKISETKSFLFFGFAGSLFLCGFSLVAAGGGYCPAVVQASRCNDLSSCGTQALGCMGFIIVAHGLSSWGSLALEHRQAQQLWHTSLVSCMGESSQTRDQTHVCLGRQILYH